MYTTLEQPAAPILWPGVFAVGDVRAGSIKRVASAVGEGAIPIPFMHRYLDGLAVPPLAGR